MPEDKGRIKELEKALSTKTAEVDSITNAFAVGDDGTIVVDTEKKTAYLKAYGEAKEIAELLQAEKGMATFNAYLDGSDNAPLGQAAYGGAQQQQTKTIGQQFLDSEAWREYKAGGFQRGMSFVTTASFWDQASMEQKDIWSMSAGTYTRQGFGEQVERPFTEGLPRRVHMRDILTPVRTTAAVVYGIRETGFVNNARPVRDRAAADGVAAPVGDDTDTFGKAPKSKLTYTTITYPAADIKHVMHLHQTLLEDEPRMRERIDRRMREGIYRSEDDQILNGDGVAPNLLGILNTVGVQTFDQEFNPGPPIDPLYPKSHTLRKAITRVTLAELDATGIILNPLDFEGIELETDSEGRLTFAVSIQVGGERRAWRLPVVETTALAQGRYLLGAFGDAAQLLDRREVRIDVSTENNDDFERSAITVRGTEKVFLTVDRPEAIVTGAFA